MTRPTVPTLLGLIALLGPAAGCEGPSAPPPEEETVLRIVGEIADGAPRDVAIGAERIWIAQGRALAALDPATGERLADHPASPFEAPLVAVAEAAGTLCLASESELIVFGPGGEERRWRESRMGRIRDLALLLDEGGAPATAVVITRNRLVHLDLRGAEIVELGAALAPPELASFSRVWIARIGGEAFALLSGDLNAYPGAGQRGLAIASLGSAPAFLRSWDPAEALGAPGASVRDLVVREEEVAGETRTFAYLAAGLGQLAKLDLGDPAAPRLEAQLTVREGAPLFGLIGGELGPLYLASAGRLDAYDPAAGALLEGLDLELAEGELRWDLGAEPGPGPGPGGERLWLASTAEQRFPVQALSLSGAAPAAVHRLGWLIRGRGVAAAPEWSRVYVPTSAGILSYDVADPTAPRPVPGGYRPGEGGSVTDLLLLYPDEADPSEAVLVSAMREGGLTLWPVSAAAPEPGAPDALPHLPAGWEGAEVVESDLAIHRDGGEIYLLAAIANRDADQSALMAYDLTRARWREVAESSAALVADSGAIAVRDGQAFVTTEGGLFVVDLRGLPEALTVVAEVTAGPEEIGAPAHLRGAAAGEGALYLGLEQPGGFLIYGYGEPRGLSEGGPIDARTSATIPGNTGRLRLDPSEARMLVPARSGNLWVMDTTEQTRLHLITRYSHPYYTGDITDARPIALPGALLPGSSEAEPLLLVSKEEEGFSLLRFARVPAP